MTKTRKKYPFFSKEAVVFLLITLLTMTVFFKYVDLTPYVDENFFFSTEDPHFQVDAEISKLFTRKDSQIIISVSGNIHSQSYQDKIHHITKILSSLESITSVKSITDGPKNLSDAIKSPFWKRALIANNQKSSNIVIIPRDINSLQLIPKIEHLISAMQSNDFRIRVSGFPYIVELIRRNLLIDLNIFSTLAFVLFSLVIMIIFHSWRILFGMIAACANASALVFMINQLLGLKIGILTANLATIIFVLTLSHIVFLTFNWKQLHYPDSPYNQHSAVKEAISHTVEASFWSMFTTLLGFLSLLIVPAKPLRELGISGAIGTLMAFICAYTIYPAFLRLKKIPHDWNEKQLKSFYHKTFRFFDKNYSALVVLIIGIIVVTSSSLWKLDTDPSLLSYFAKDSEIFEGLEYIDKNGGSSPLVLVLRDQEGQLLNTNKIYKRLWQLHKNLENHPDVGTAISLPALLAEGKRRPFSFFASLESLLKKMEQEKYDRIAASFITPDRQNGLFLVRMNEQGRKLHRLEVIEQIKQITRRHGFAPHLIGGIYALQGYLSRHIATSLIYGLGRLILAFTVIAFIVSHSLRISLAMTFSISLVPLCILGCVGYFKIPLDTISAPAANVAIAMGIDAMIHMAHAYHRLKKQGKHHLDDWVKVRRKLWEPIITSMLIICAGFGIFFFSSFPPTQRFGGSIVFGTVCAAITALFIFPLLAKRHR